MEYPKDPVQLYDMAWELAKQDSEIMKEYDWLVNVACKTNIAKLSKREFLERYSWVVYVSGFKKDIIDKIWEDLRRAFHRFYPEKISDHCVKLAVRVFAHESKAKAVVKTAKLLHQNSWEAFREVYLASPFHMQILPFIGPTTCYHLARNLGMAHAKPDRHLLRLARHCGYNNDVQALCEFIAEKKNVWVGAVDMILWYLGEERGTIELDKVSHSIKSEPAKKSAEIDYTPPKHLLGTRGCDVPCTIIPDERGGRSHPYVFKPIENRKDIELCKTLSDKLLRTAPDVQETFICLLQGLSRAYERKSIKNQYRFKVKGHPFIYIDVESDDCIGVSIKTHRIEFLDPENKFKDWRSKGKNQIYKYKWIDSKEQAECITEYIIKNVKI